VRSSTEYIPGATVYDTVYRAGDTLVFIDTIRAECDSARQIITVPVYKQKVCPPAVTIREFRIDTITVTKENTAKTRAAELRAQAAEAKALEWGEKNLQKTRRILIDGVIIVGLLGWTFRKPIVGLIKRVIV